VDADFTTPLRRWNRNYILCLKLAELELSGGAALGQFRAFLKWSFDDFILGGPSIGLAAHYLAPNSTRKGLLKRLKSHNRQAAPEGIRNAAWDLTLISVWLDKVEAQKGSNTISLLASFDRSIHRLVHSVIDYSSADDPKSARLLSLQQLWGSRLGADLDRDISALYGDRGRPSRRVNADVQDKSVDEFIREGESAVLAWTDGACR
jgi:hypothetical protein